jgi:hypothetical protein
VNSSSYEISGMRHSLSEDKDRSTTGTFSEGLPCSNTGKQGLCEEISNGDPGAVEIQTALAMVLSHRSMRKSPSWKESESA